MLGDSPSIRELLDRPRPSRERIKVHHLKFRIHIGPLSLEEYERLLPTGSVWSGSSRWCGTISATSFPGDDNLILLRRDVPSVKLGEAGMTRLDQLAVASAQGRNPVDQSNIGLPAATCRQTGCGHRWRDSEAGECRVTGNATDIVIGFLILCLCDCRSS